MTFRGRRPGGLSSGADAEIGEVSVTTAVPLRWVLVAAFVLTPVVTVAGPLHGFDIPKLVALATLGAALAALSALLVPDLWRHSIREARALLVVAGAFAIWLLVATFVSDTSRLSLLGPDGRFVGTVATFFPVVLMAAVPVAVDGWKRFDRLLLLLAGVLGAIGAYGAMQWAGFDPMPWGVPRGGRPVATFGNSNFVGAALCVTTPVALYLWYRRPALRIAAVPLLVLGAVVIWASEARLGMVAAAAGAVVFLGTQLRWPLERVQGWAVALAVPLAPVVGTLTVVAGILIEDRTGLARLGYWRAAVPMWLDNPVLGVGLGRFAAYHPAYRPPEAVVEAGAEIQVDSSHHWLLDLAATTGTPGALLWLAALVAAGLLLRQVWSLDDQRYRPAVAALTGMLAAHGVQSSISVPTIVPVWLGWLLLALTLALGVLAVPPQSPWRGGKGSKSSPGERSSGPVRRRGHSATNRADRARQQRTTLVVSAVALVMAGLVLIPAVAVWNTARDLGTAASLLRIERHDLARAPMEDAVQRTPWWPEPWWELMRVAAAQGDAELVQTATEGAYAADPRNRSTMFASLEAVLAVDDIEAGAPWIERLRALDPNGIDANLTVAAWALQVDDHDLAGEALDAAAAVVEPGISGWERYEQLRATHQEAS